MLEPRGLKNEMELLPGCRLHSGTRRRLFRQAIRTRLRGKYVLKFRTLIFSFAALYGKEVIFCFVLFFVFLNADESHLQRVM